MAALLAGQGVNEVAAAYNLSPSLISRWKKTLPEVQLQQVATKKEEAFGDLVGDYLRQILVTLRLQAEHAADKDWFQKQSASEIAVFHGVLADKGFRLLEAASRIDDPGEEPAGE